MNKIIFAGSLNLLHEDSGRPLILRNFAPCCECVRVDIVGMRKAGGVKVRSWKGTEGEGGAQVLPQCIWGWV